jgi:hypothetical protein
MLCVAVVLAVSAIGTKIKERELFWCGSFPGECLRKGEKGGGYRDSNGELAR